MFDKEIRNVIHNSLYLLATQGVAYIAPILILGHLIKTLGVEGFGKYALCLSVAAYLQVVVDYGFSFSASRQISQNRNNREYISKIYWTTISIKVLICLIVFPIYVYIINLFALTEIVKSALYATYILILGNTLFPVWFYQGIEKLKIIAILNLFSRVFACLLVVLLVNNKDDLALSLYMQALPVLIGGVIANVDIFVKKYVSYSIPKMVDYRKSIIEGWDIFVATLASTVLSNSTIFILGIYSSPSVVGFYAAVERIVKAAVSLFAPITRSLYPYNCNKFNSSYSEGLRSVSRTGKPLAVLALMASVILILCWNYIAIWLNLQDGSFYIACILAVWLFFGVVNNILGIQILSASGHAKLYSRSFMLAALLTVVLLLILVKAYSSIGAAMAITFGEVILFVILLLQVHKLRVQLPMVKIKKV